MRVLVTGHNGYIGCSLVPLLQDAGHDVVGLDNYLYETCTFGLDTMEVPAVRKDIRDVELSDLAGFDAVIHLAAISNDPVGDLNPDAAGRGARLIVTSAGAPRQHPPSHRSRSICAANR